MTSMRLSWAGLKPVYKHFRRRQRLTIAQDPVWLLFGAGLTDASDGYYPKSCRRLLKRRPTV